MHQSRRRFQAIADTREEARVAARDFNLDHQTPAGRVEIAAVVAAWEMAKEFAGKEVEVRAEAKVLGHRRILQVQERQAMLKAVTDTYGKLNEAETPSAEYLATKAEECEKQRTFGEFTGPYLFKEGFTSRKPSDKHRPHGPCQGYQDYAEA